MDDHSIPLADTAFLDSIIRIQKDFNKKHKKKITARTIVFCSFLAGPADLMIVRSARAAYILAHEINFNTIMKSRLFAEKNFNIKRGDLLARRILKEGQAHEAQ